VGKSQTVVLFDAVGTVIKPVPGVVETYERLGRAHASRLTTEEIKRRIKLGREKYFQVGTAIPVCEKIDFRSDDQIERRLWKRLVLDVFDDVQTSEKLFDELWDHFDKSENWQLYDDVVPCWTSFRNQGCLIGLASNFDSRLLSICKQIPPLDSADFVFHSAGVGFRKPSPNFYRTVEDTINRKIGPAKILMIGDDLTNDCLAPNQHEWSSTWLNRIKKEISDNDQVSTLIEFSSRHRV